MIFRYLGARLISVQLPPAPCPRGTTWQDLAEILVQQLGASKTYAFQRKTGNFEISIATLVILLLFVALFAKLKKNSFWDG